MSSRKRQKRKRDEDDNDDEEEKEEELPWYLRKKRRDPLYDCVFSDYVIPTRDERNKIKQAQTESDEYKKRIGKILPQNRYPSQTLGSDTVDTKANLSKREILEARLRRVKHDMAVREKARELAWQTEKQHEEQKLKAKFDKAQEQAEKNKQRRQDQTDETVFSKRKNTNPSATSGPSPAAAAIALEPALKHPGATSTTPALANLILVEYSSSSFSGQDAIAAIDAAFQRILHGCHQQRSCKFLHLCFDLLIKYLQNICRNPSNPRFRQIRLDNRNVREQILPCDENCSLLTSLGFQVENGVAVFSVDSHAELRLCLLEIFERFLRAWMCVLPQHLGRLFDLQALEHHSARNFQAWVEAQYSEYRGDMARLIRRRLQSTPLCPEPLPGDPQSVQIGFFLQGAAARRTTRRFLQTDTIAQLFAFAQTLVAALVCPFQDFDLARNQGSKREMLSNMSSAMTLKELGMAREMLHVIIIR